MREKPLTYGFLTPYNEKAHVICKDCDGDSMSEEVPQSPDRVGYGALWNTGRSTNASESRGQVEARRK